MDAECPAGRAEAVGRIDVSTVLLVEFVSPVVLIGIPIRIEVVDICSLGVDDLSEETLLCHVEGG
jgi:hypothetical protein